MLLNITGQIGIELWRVNYLLIRYYFNDNMILKQLSFNKGGGGIQQKWFKLLCDNWGDEFKWVSDDSVCLFLVSLLFLLTETEIKVSLTSSSRFDELIDWIFYLKKHQQKQYLKLEIMKGMASQLCSRQKTIPQVAWEMKPRCINKQIVHGCHQLQRWWVCLLQNLFWQAKSLSPTINHIKRC